MNPKSSYRFPYARYPAVRLVVCFAVGIIIGFWIDAAVRDITVILCSLLAGYGLLEYVQAESINPKLRNLTVVCFLLLIMGSGWLHFINSKYKRYDSLPLQKFKQSSRWESAEFYGQVIEISSSKNRRSLLIRVDSVGWGDTLSFTQSFKMRASADISQVDYLEMVVLGDRIRFISTLYPVEPPRNPHQFDYASFLKRERIAVTGGIDKILRIRPPPDNFSWIKVRRNIHKLINSNFSSDRQPLAKAILIGDKGELEDRVTESFSRAGLAHIMAVSGMHVGFLVAPLWFMIPWCWRFRWGKILGLVGIALVVLLYAGITGFSASVTRASMMAILLAYAKIFHRRRQSINLAAVAALVLLIKDPFYLFDIGFQLSFAAVFAILLVWPLIDRKFGSVRDQKWWHVPFKLFLLSLLVQLALLPLLARYFGEMSLIGPVVNMIAMAAMGVLIQWGLFCLGLSAFWPDVGAWFNVPVDAILGYIQLGVQWISQLPGSWIGLKTDHPLLSIVWILVILALAASEWPHFRWKWWIAVLLALICWQVDSIYRQWSTANQLSVTVLDVGQGDAIIVHTPTDKTMLIDAGHWTPDYNSGDRTIVPHLKAEGIDTLHAVLFSHPHADHIGGMEAILEQIPVKTIYHSGVNYSSNLFSRIRQLAKSKGVAMKQVHTGHQIPLDLSIRCYVVGPDPGARHRVKDINNASLTVKLVYGEQHFLFMGDAGRRQEQRMIIQFEKAKGNVLRSDYFKAGHHGSNTSSSRELLKIVRPSVSVVSLGWRNRYRHPHPAAVNRLQTWTEDTLHFTSRDRAVIYVSDGKQMQLMDWDNQQF